MMEKKGEGVQCDNTQLWSDEWGGVGGTLSPCHMGDLLPVDVWNCTRNATVRLQVSFDFATRQNSKFDIYYIRCYLRNTKIKNKKIA